MKIRKIRQYPTQLSIEVTNKCNLNCLACNHEENIPQKVAKNMPMILYREILPLMSYAQRVMLFGCGEPFLNPHILQMISLARENSEAQIRINTNGTLLTNDFILEIAKSGLNELIISIDGATQETNGALRSGTDLRKIFHYMAVLADCSRRCRSELRIGVEFVAMRRNIEELPDLVMVVSKLGAAFVQVSYLVVKKEELEEESLFFHQAECDTVFDTAQQIANTQAIQLILPARFRDACNCKRDHVCLQPWTNAFVGCSGEVYVCCFGGRLCRAGNIRIGSWNEIWHGHMYQRIRAEHLQNKLSGPCKCCFFSRPEAIVSREAHIRTEHEELRSKKPIDHLEEY